MQENGNQVPANEVEVPPVEGDGVERLRCETAGTNNVAVFWRRFFAFIIDFVILGAAGLVLGFFFGRFFVLLGNWGRLVGFFMAALYFVPLDSEMGDGQTPGKRLFKVRVVDGGGRSIPLALSALRFLIVAGPVFLNRVNISSRVSDWLEIYLLVVILFGVGGGIVYFSVFNRKTRQSLHDVICGTYVVREGATGEPAARSVATLHYVIYAVFFACIIGLTVFGVPRLLSLDLFKNLSRMQVELERVNGVRSADVVAGKYFMRGGGRRYLNATVFLEGKPESFQDVVDKAGRVVMLDYPDLDKFSTVTVGAVYGYDIGVYSSYRSYYDSKPPRQWLHDLGMDKAE